MSPRAAIREVRYVADGIAGVFGMDDLGCEDKDAMRWVRRLRRAADALDAHYSAEHKHNRSRLCATRRVTE